jgi:hypothetical protein
LALRVNIATTADDLEALFRCRHRVYVGQDGMTPDPSGMISDACDAWPEPDCVNFVAVREGEVVGGVRLLRRVPGRVPSSDLMFDFAPHLTPGKVQASGTMLCFDTVHKAAARRLTSCLMTVMYHYAIATGVEEIYGCIRESLWPMSQTMGGRALAEPQVRGPITWVPFVAPMRGLLDMERWGAVLRDHDVAEFVGIWCRQFLEPGEVVYRRGEQAEEAFVVVSGAVELRRPGRVPLTVARPWMFGEEEMVDGLERELDVVAATPLDLIVVDRDAFFRQVAGQPKGAVKFAKLLLDAQDDDVSALRGGPGETLDVPDAPPDKAPDVANAPDPRVPLVHQARMGE